MDRSFGKKIWLDEFLDYSPIFLEKRGSDHRHVWLKLCDSPEINHAQFQFYKRFLGQPEVENGICKTWTCDNQGQRCNVFQKIRKCRKASSFWKRKKNTNEKDEIFIL